MFGLGGRDEDCSCLQDQCALDALRTALLACLDAQHSGYIFSGCLPLPPPLAQHSHTLTHAHTHFSFSPHGHVFSKQCDAHAVGQQGSLRTLSGTLAPAHSNYACHACFPSHTLSCTSFTPWHKNVPSTHQPITCHAWCSPQPTRVQDYRKAEPC